MSPKLHITPQRYSHPSTSRLTTPQGTPPIPPIPPILHIPLISLISLISLILFLSPLSAQNTVDYVNPFIGTDNYGATHPGAVAPWGMVSVVPFNVAGPQNNPDKDSRWHSTPYWSGNPFLTGFSHVNLSGVGCPDLGVLLLMPTTGELKFNHLDYGSAFSEEEAHPGYYTAQLDKYNIKAEMTATTRTGMSRYTFPEGESHILLNLGLGLTNESGAALHIVSPTEVEGYKLVGDFCYNPGSERPVYFVARFSGAPREFGLWKKQPKLQGVEDQWSKHSGSYKRYPGYRQWLAGDSIGVYFSYVTEENEAIEVRLGVSYVSIENARQNLDAEQPDVTFEQIRQNTQQAWEMQLSRVVVEGGTEENKVKFYTALYHVLLHPNIFQDINGQYPAMGSDEILTVPDGQNRYTVFSLWDTYRNVHPLLSLLYPERQLNMVRSMVAMSKESGWLPKWELLSRETNVMVGDPATIVIADTWLRGLKDFDDDQAYRAMVKAATKRKDNPLRPGIDAYLDKGYIPIDGPDQVWGSLSTTLEYNLADWNLAQLSLAMGRTSDFYIYNNRAYTYKKFYDPKLQVLRPLMADGTFIQDFDPAYGMNFEPVPGFVEGSAWMYTFFVPHDMPGRIALSGEETFVSQLQRCFDDSLFSMHNEPDITYPFLFNYVEGETWRSQRAVRDCIDGWFGTGPSGLPGNDDTGTLSAWLVYAMLGFYPDCPGKMEYTLSTPVFDKATLKLNTAFFPGSEVVIEAEGKGDYIKKMTWNGERLKAPFLSHESLVKGGRWVVERKANP